MDQMSTEIHGGIVDSPQFETMSYLAAGGTAYSPRFETRSHLSAGAQGCLLNAASIAQIIHT